MQDPYQSIPTYSQNFFRSGALVERLLDASTIRPGDLVLDLGAGTGVISSRLARRGCEVLAVEKDARLAQQLRVDFARNAVVRVLHTDILHVHLPHRAYKVFSNIPFDASSAIVNRLTRTVYSPQDAYLVIQRESAQRFLGQPRTTLAAASIFPWFEATPFHAFRPTDFTPVPRVEVVMLRLRKRGPPLVPHSDAQLYRDFIVRIFTARTACVTDSLRLLIGKRPADRLARTLDLSGATPAHISVERWLDLFNATHSLMSDELRWSVAHAERRLRTQQRGLHKVHRTASRRLRPPPRPNAAETQGSRLHATRIGRIATTANRCAWLHRTDLEP